MSSTTNQHDASTATTTTMQRYVVVIRHGERLDYVMRDLGSNWLQLTNPLRPWDPPLSNMKGHEQGRLSGQRLKLQLQQMGLPPITAVYSSPLLRCRQTACAIIKGLLLTQQQEEQEQETNNNINNDSSSTTTAATSATTTPNLKVRVEIGLAESMNESWYRSWALPGSDGTWGFIPPDHNRIIDPSTVHPACKIPAEQILMDWKQQQTTTTTTKGAR